MFNPSIHPRNDESHACQSSGGQSETSHQSSLNEVSNVPHFSVSSVDIDNARKLLENERLGICYRDVLARLSQAPWTFLNSIDSSSADLTIKLLEFNPQLAREYKEKFESEGALARLLASVGLLRSPLASKQFLESIRELNLIVQDMNEAGLLQIEYFPPEKILTGDRQNPIHIGPRYSRISVTDLGNLALQT